MTVVKILGFIKAIHSASSPPTNTQMLWYDTNVNLHKYWSTVGSSWVPLAAGGATWASVLASNAHSGAVNPIIDSGQSINWENSGFVTTFETETLTANRLLQLPDKDGILATIADVTSAGNLNAVLGVGNTTGGLNIELSNGDVIQAVSGSGILNLRNGADDVVLLSGGTVSVSAATQANLVGPVAEVMSTVGNVSIDGFTGVDFKVNSSVVANVNASGISAGNIAPADSHFQSNYTASAPASAGSAFKVNSTIDFSMGAAATYAWMSSWSGELFINPTSGFGVGIGNGTVSPASLNANVKLLVASNDVEFALRKASVANTSEIGFYTANNKQHSIHTNITDDLIIQSLATNRDIIFQVNTVQQPLIIDGGQLMVYMNMNYGAIPQIRQNPSSPIESIFNLTTIEYVTTVSTNIDGINGGRDGKMVHMINTGNGVLNFRHNQVATSQKIFTPTGGSVAIGKDESVTLYYSLTSAAWFILG